MIISAHQSQFMPWPPYFKKVALSDAFVWMDDVQFHRGDRSCVQNRNQIWSPQGALWLTLPVKKSGLQTRISEVELLEDRLSKKSWKSLEVYRKAPYWQVHGEALRQVLCEASYTTLDGINWAFFQYVLMFLNIKTRVVRLSDLNLKSEKNDLVLDMCQSLNAKTYISGFGAKAYLDETSFVENGIDIVYLYSKSIEYKQFKPPYLVGLSMLDMMMNCAKDQIMEYLMDTSTLEIGGTRK